MIFLQSDKLKVIVTELNMSECNAAHTSRNKDNFCDLMTDRQDMITSRIQVKVHNKDILSMHAENHYHHYV